MQENRVSEACLYASSGYGYNDIGATPWKRYTRQPLAQRMPLCAPRSPAEPTRWQWRCPETCSPGDELLSPVGKPYDTLEEVIGIRPSNGSLAEYGVSYRQVDLFCLTVPFDYEGIRKAVKNKTKLVTIQRSKRAIRPGRHCLYSGSVS